MAVAGLASSTWATARLRAARLGRKPLATGTWHHYAGTYDGAMACAYIDGVQVASNPYTGGAIALSGQDFNIARNPVYGGGLFRGHALGREDVRGSVVGQ
jgi:hypothetical protein